ncbi:MAG: hypothetical protein KGS09_09710 [Nitrospirae bacterium]|nr:hypothetical protein [Nitrospirota bacterium]MDE3048449.1 hypothetical protein [Nitrospirota bacterium]MDE3218030.1 hypothetical protein [Nitrospirota bacterium]
MAQFFEGGDFSGMFDERIWDGCAGSLAGRRKTISAQQNIDGLHVLDNRRTPQQGSGARLGDRRNEMEIQSIHIASFSHISRFTRHDLWLWRTVSASC